MNLAYYQLIGVNVTDTTLTDAEVEALNKVLAPYKFDQALNEQLIIFLKTIKEIQQRRFLTVGEVNDIIRDFERFKTLIHHLRRHPKALIQIMAGTETFTFGEQGSMIIKGLLHDILPKDTLPKEAPSRSKPEKQINLRYQAAAAIMLLTDQGIDQEKAEALTGELMAIILPDWNYENANNGEFEKTWYREKIRNLFNRQVEPTLKRYRQKLKLRDDILLSR